MPGGISSKNKKKENEIKPNKEIVKKLTNSTDKDNNNINTKKRIKTNKKEKKNIIKNLKNNKYKSNQKTNNKYK